MSDNDLAEDMLDSVVDWRSRSTTPAERQIILDFWAQHGVHNQFQAIVKAARLEREG